MPPTPPPNPEHVLAGAPIKLGVKAKGSKKVDSAAFVFTNGAGEQVGEKVSCQVGSGTFSAEFKPPAPRADEDSYRLRCELEVGAEKQPIGQEWVVWHADVSLTTKQKDSAGQLQPLGQLRVNLKQGEQSKLVPIPSEGTAAIKVPQPGGFTIDVGAPIKFVQWVAGKDKGSALEMEVEEVPARARIVSPPTLDGVQRRYVNVKKAEFEVPVELMSWGEGPVADQELHVEVVFENSTKRGTLRPPTADADYFKERTVAGLTNPVKSNNDLTWKGTVRTGADAKARFTVYLGKGGGERCTIKVGSTSTVEDAKLEYETWRKLYVQFCHSGTAKTQGAFPAGQRQATIDAYAQVFVELELLDDVKFPDPIDVSDRCGWHDSGEIGEDAGTKVFVVNIDGSSWKKLYEKVRPKDTDKHALLVNIAACDLMFEVSNVTFSKTILGGASCTGKLEVKGVDVPGAGSTTYFGRLPNKPIYKTKVRCLLAKLVNGKNVPEGAAFDLPASCVDVSYFLHKSDRGKLTITLPKDTTERLKADDQLQAQLSIDAMLCVEDAGAAGCSDGAHSIILNDDACGDAETNNTVIHEIGHCINMCAEPGVLSNKGSAQVVHRLPDYALGQVQKSDGSRHSTWSFIGHSRWYEGRGHDGDHCAAGLGQSDYAKWGNLGGYRLGNLGTYTCVIYGQAQQFRTPLSYCAECQDVIKAMEVWLGSLPASRP